VFLWLGVILVVCSTLKSLMLWLGNRGEEGLGHLLTAAALQGLGLLAHLARPWVGLESAPAGLLLLAGSGYGLWALRLYSGMPARPRRWEWTVLGLWALGAVALHGTGLAVPSLLLLLALGGSLELRRLAREGDGQLPALVCEGLILLLALGAGVAAIPSAFFAELRSSEAVLARAGFCFAVLGVHQLFTFLLAQVQGQRLRRRLGALGAIDLRTGLASALGFREHLDRAVGRSLRTGKVSSVLILELDGFEALAAVRGRAPLNHLLEAFALTLNRTLREVDFTARLEGCRFSALLHQTQANDALLAAERLRAAWSNLPLPLHPTLSGAVASTAEPVQGAQDLLDLALTRLASVRLAGGDNLEGAPRDEATAS
jgi:diguanylate cyclase (GGDEF)-like protein